MFLADSSNNKNKTNKNMIIDLKILGGKTLQMNVPDDAHVKYLKDLIEKQNKISKSQQKLVFKGKTLSDDKSLSSYGIVDGSKIHLVVKKETIGSDKAGPAYHIDDFWKSLRTVLSKTYNEREVENIVQQYETDYKKILRTISLDDIERIATQKLKPPMC